MSITFNALKDCINAILLPDDISFYEIDGQKVFPIIGSSGGIASTSICYLIHRCSPSKIAVQPIEFSGIEIHATMAEHILFKLRAAINQFKRDLASENCKLVSLDGELLGRESWTYQGLCQCQFH